MAITLRRAQPGDYKDIARIFDGASVVLGTGQNPFADEEVWRTKLANPNPDQHKLVAVIDDKVVGMGDLSPGKNHLRHIGFVGLMVDEAHHNKGVGTAVLKALVDLADNWLGFRKLELYVYTDNAPALRLYQKFGFEIEGTRRQMALRAGVYKDAYAMGRLRTENHTVSR